MSDAQRTDRGPAGAVVRTAVLCYGQQGPEQRSDSLACEEPLEIRVVAERDGRRERHGVAVTMRTPGHDFELAAGFLFSEGVIAERASIWRIDYCEDEDVAETEERNIVEAFLAPGVPFDPRKFSRNVYTTSSCGICGKTSIDLVRMACPALPKGDLTIEAGRLKLLADTLQGAQPIFQRTGGLHAAALFDRGGRLQRLREDVGRHNALDKLIGGLLLEGSLPGSEGLVLVSGRASFELVQKAAVAGIPVLAAVGAPSSLAVDLAHELHMTLVGFLREGRFNVYSGAERIV